MEHEEQLVDRVHLGSDLGRVESVLVVGYMDFDHDRHGGRNGTAVRRYGVLTIRRVLQLLRTDVYTIDPETGTVYAQDGGELATFTTPRSDRRFVRLYDGGRRMGIAVSRLVWMSQTGERVPAGFEIHHEDNDETNDAWSNLICLHKLDHRKKHRLDEVPF